MSATLVPPTEQLGTLADRPQVGAAGPKRHRERLLSLDVFRGLTVAGMLLRNDPGTWSAGDPPLEHATWHGRAWVLPARGRGRPDGPGREAGPETARSSFRHEGGVLGRGSSRLGPLRPRQACAEWQSHP